jgi:alanyl-tRNA synthetase
MSNISEEQKGNYYIIADHLRTTIFALADGAEFEPKGRGYILKKLVKKAVLLTYFLNFSVSDLLLISQKIIEVNKKFYSHLKENENSIIESLKKEIEKEKKLIQNAQQKIIKYCSKNIQKSIPAQEIFLWYDTYGIPLELIDYCLKKNEKTFSRTEFGELLKKQKLLGEKDRKSKKLSAFDLKK